MGTGIEALEARTLCATGSDAPHTELAAQVAADSGRSGNLPAAHLYTFANASSVHGSASTPTGATLWSTNADGTSTVYVPGTVVLGKKGTLLVTGTASADTVSVKRVGRRINVAVSTAVPIDSDRSVSVTTFWGFDTDQVHGIAVEAGGGLDALDLDQSTQPITHDSGVERRRVTVQGRRTVGDAHAQALPGVYGGSTQEWAERSARQIADPARTSADVAVLGDSMMANFQLTGAASYARTFGRHSVDLGLPGDTTAQLLYRIERQGLLDGMTAGTVVLNIGTNNASLSDDADAIARGVAAVVASIRQRLPDAKILLLGILPQQRPKQDRVINRVNDRIATFDDGNTVRFLSGTDAFTGDRAKEKYYRVNNQHLNAHGYAAWSSLIVPALVELSGV